MQDITNPITVSQLLYLPNDRLLTIDYPDSTRIGIVKSRGEDSFVFLFRDDNSASDEVVTYVEVVASNPSRISLSDIPVTSILLRYAEDNLDRLLAVKYEDRIWGYRDIILLSDFLDLLKDLAVFVEDFAEQAGMDHDDVMYEEFSQFALRLKEVEKAQDISGAQNVGSIYFDQVLQSSPSLRALDQSLLHYSLSRYAHSERLKAESFNERSIKAFKFLHVIKK